ncbi:TPA: phage tail protein [Mannheimia haemolytica]|uniref:bacteriophage tail protein n=1 Tax=Mannheimia haemolytica TaxID=75985 RepID=UPI0002C4E8FE|nr:bacteriophage tail protein [Mannheimia haemolytica]AGI35711.1 phage tail protein [Mannheimia haemolytica USDA-ARS-USMARC-185]EPY99517.1 phage tail protein [Mannheimia haemolytica D35]MCB4228027.1 phage tail protein [Mannheimia haemolytica]MDW0618188.1 phage tail protein [Mannheimia haemolytica]MDW1151041.1 phage tail protein [Mannheimia haemolytica]
MSSPFEQAIAAADQTIQQTMMSEWLIGGKPYPAVYDEAPAIFNGLHSADERAIHGTERTLTLFRASGYKPRLDDRVSGNGKKYLVKSYHFVDQLIVLQLE